MSIKKRANLFIGYVTCLANVHKIIFHVMSPRVFVFVYFLRNTTGEACGISLHILGNSIV